MGKSIKEFLKKVLERTGLYNIARKFYHLFRRNEIRLMDNRVELEQMIQVGIMNQYKIIASMRGGQSRNN
jgi:hypothetical protein